MEAVVRYRARFAFWVNSGSSALSLLGGASIVLMHGPLWHAAPSAIASIVAAVAAAICMHRAFPKKRTEITTKPTKIDSTEPIIAYRGWHMAGDNLTAIAKGVYWKARAVQQCECQSVSLGVKHSHDAPYKNCLCGYYAFKDEQSLIQVLDYGEAIIGRVALWGRIIEHESGYRSEYAYPQVLYTHPALTGVQRVAEKYGIETAPMPDHLRPHYDSMLERRQQERFDNAWSAEIQIEQWRKIENDPVKRVERAERQRAEKVKLQSVFSSQGASMHSYSTFPVRIGH